MGKLIRQIKDGLGTGYLHNSLHRRLNSSLFLTECRERVVGWGRTILFRTLTLRKPLMLLKG